MCPRCKLREKTQSAGYCRVCVREYNRDYTSKHRDEMNAKARAKYNPEAHREKHLKKKFNLTLSEYELMLKTQDGVCAICKNPETKLDRTGKVSPLSTDHDHLTNKVRSLLCHRCNSALGYLRENTSIMYSMIEYVNSFK